MGIIPGPTTYGNDCLLCFDAGETPEFFKVFISGVTRTDFWLPGSGEAPNGYHDLKQHPVDSCRWSKEPYTIPRGWFMHHVGHSHLHWEANAGVPAFVSQSPGPCAYHFTNQMNNAPGNMFWKGYALIAVAGTVSGGGGSPFVNLANVINKLTPMVDPDPRMECFPMADGEIVVRYAGKRDGTNISILFDTTH